MEREDMRERINIQPLINRLHRIEGQARGIEQMLEDSRDCGDIVQQISAMRSAVDRLGYELVLTNLRACLTATDLTPRSEDEIEKALSALSGLRS